MGFYFFCNGRIRYFRSYNPLHNDRWPEEDRRRRRSPHFHDRAVWRWLTTRNVTSSSPKTS